MSPATLQSILSQHGFPRTCWEAWRYALQHVRSDTGGVNAMVAKRRQLCWSFNAVLDELSKGVKHKFPPSMRKAG